MSCMQVLFDYDSDMEQFLSVRLLWLQFFYRSMKIMRGLHKLNLSTNKVSVIDLIWIKESSLIWIIQLNLSTFLWDVGCVPPARQSVHGMQRKT